MQKKDTHKPLLPLVHVNTKLAYSQDSISFLLENYIRIAIFRITGWLVGLGPTAAFSPFAALGAASSGLLVLGFGSTASFENTITLSFRLATTLARLGALGVRFVVQ